MMALAKPNSNTGTSGVLFFSSSVSVSSAPFTEMPEPYFMRGTIFAAMSSFRMNATSGLAAFCEELMFICTVVQPNSLASMLLTSLTAATFPKGMIVFFLTMKSNLASAWSS